MKNYVLQIKNTAIVSCVNPVFIMKIHKPIIAVIDFFTNFNGLYFQHKKEKRHFIHKSHWIHFTSGFIEWSTKLIGGRKRKYAKNIIQPRKNLQWNDIFILDLHHHNQAGLWCVLAKWDQWSEKMCSHKDLKWRLF